ncbi:MAG TPA: Hsp20/alpha crystallin family protein [Acidimicrobiia bacterium]|nr:Hsp20/alpha crystallin family protein [Acidimicrobiia bacterium]
MELKVWSPFFDLDRALRSFEFPTFESPVFRPSIDVMKKDGEIVVTAELPGIDPEQVEVSFEDDVLVIKGEKSEEKEVTEDDRYMRERTFGRFQRRIALPAGTSPDSMSAHYDKGVLTVTVKLPTESLPQARTIPIEVTTS